MVASQVWQGEAEDSERTVQLDVIYRLMETC